MSRNLRKRARVCYHEPEEPPFDEFVFCTECRDYVYEYCSIHGPLLIIPDEKVGARTGFPAFVPRAALTIPRVFLHLAYSRIPEAGLGVFSTLTLPVGVRFGPYRGQRVQTIGDSTYGWQICDRNHKPSYIVDARDPNRSNWMRYVNCSRHHLEQNLVAYQYQGQLYYRTVKVVPRFTELLVFYGSEFANRLGVDLRGYRKPCPCPKCQARLLAAKKLDSSKTNKRKAPEEDKNAKQSEKIDSAKTIQKPSTSHALASSTAIQEKKENPKKKNAKENLPLNIQGVSTDTHNDVPSSTATQQKKKKLKEKNDTNNFPRNIQGISAVTKNDLLSSTAIQVEKGKSNEKIPKNNIPRNIVGISAVTQNYLPSSTAIQEKKENWEEKKAEKISPKNIQGISAASTKDLLSSTDTMKVSPEQTAVSSSSSKTNTNGENNFKCDKCSKNFNIKSDLEKHINTHILMEASTGLASKIFMCKTCNYKFDTKLLLREHEESRHGIKYFVCKECNYATKYAPNLQRHIRTHTGERPYKCSQCKSAFTQLSNLHSHQIIHTDDKPFKCTQCKAAFKLLSNLKAHKIIHTDDKPFKCTQCKSAFKRLSNLRAHQIIHTGDKPFECNICDYKANQSSDLKRHLMSRHSGQKPFGCDACSYRGATRNHLQHHMKKNHN